MSTVKRLPVSPRNQRWIVEGVWSGYRSSQERPCHRRVYQGRPILRKQLEAIRAVVFTDGTTMTVSVRNAMPREKVQEINGYTSLLDDCVSAGLTGYASVQALIDQQKAKEANQCAQ